MAVFLSAAMQQRLNGDVAPGNQGAGALGAIKLVRGQGQGVGAGFGEIERHFAGGLDGVDMQIAAGRPQTCPQGRRIVDDAGLVVGPHQGAEAGSGRQFRKGLGQGQAVGADRQDMQGPASGGQEACRFENGRMLGGADEHGARLQRAGHALDGQIVGLGAAAGENDLGRLGPRQGGYLLTGAVDGAATQASQTIQGRGIAVEPAEVRRHGLADAVVERSGGVVIKVDHVPTPISPAFPAQGGS